MMQGNDTQKGRFLTFSLSNEEYGIDIGRVKEIIVIGTQIITELPELPEYLPGIINLRGKIIPLMDVRLRFKKQKKEYDDRTCIIVVELQNNNLGLIVDSVSEVISISEENIVPLPQISRDTQNKFIKAVGKADNHTRLLLECDNLLKDDELLVLSSIT
jgi:purine-binding chemotaxis protein CheW